MSKGKLAVAVLMFTCVAAAQDNENRFDFAISGSGVFSKKTSSSSGSVTDTPTKSAAFTGTFRYRFRPKHAVEVNLGRTRNSQIFFVPPNTYRVQNSITEFTVDYSFSPLTLGKLRPFIFAGGGALHFSPGNTFIDTFATTIPVATQTSMAFLYGVGADYPVWRMISARVQYRGLFFKEPDFAVPALFFTGAKGHLAEPSAGIVLRF